MDKFNKAHNLCVFLNAEFENAYARVTNDARARVELMSGMGEPLLWMEFHGDCTPAMAARICAAALGALTL